MKSLLEMIKRDTDELAGELAAARERHHRLEEQAAAHQRVADHVSRASVHLERNQQADALRELAAAYELCGPSMTRAEIADQLAEVYAASLKPGASWGG